MPSKKFTSGSPLGAIRDSRWLNFVNAGAEIAQRASYEGGDVTTGEPRTSVQVRNSSGGALDRFAIVGISDVLIAPDANESEFLNYFALDADAPDTDRDGPGRIAVLQAPLADEKIGPALLWGMTPVKIDLPDGSTYTAASIIDGDATKLQADDDGAIPVVWHEDGPGEKWALVHLGAGGGGGTDTTTLTDGCECNQNLFAEGVALTSGTPTVCCESHKRWTIDLGDTIGTKTLYHLQDNIWSTFNSDSNLDNPYEHECYPSSDEYDVVMELTSTGAAITLEARASLNCDEVCFTYERALPFRCKGPNQFNLIRHEGFSDIPPCVCIKPRQYSNCDILECAPSAAIAIVSGLYVMSAYDHECNTPPATIDCGCHCSPDYSSTVHLPRVTDSSAIQDCGLFSSCLAWETTIGTCTDDIDCCRSSLGCNTIDRDIKLYVCITSGGQLRVQIKASTLQVNWSKSISSPNQFLCNEEIEVPPTSSGSSLSSCSVPAVESLDPVYVRFVGQGLPTSSGHCTPCGGA